MFAVHNIWQCYVDFCKVLNVESALADVDIDSVSSEIATKLHLLIVIIACISIYS